MTVKVNKLCAIQRCGQRFETTAGSHRIYCDKHSESPRLKNNNPKGYNKHKKNPNPLSKPLTEIEIFEAKNKEQQHDDLAKLGNEIWFKSKELQKLKCNFTKKQKIHFGWRWD